MTIIKPAHIVCSDLTYDVTSKPNYSGGGESGPSGPQPLYLLDASVTSSISDAGGAVNAWSDPRGNGFSVTQTTSSLQPTTGAETLNGLNVIQFNADNLDNTSLPQSIPDSTFTFFCVHKASADTTFVFGLAQDREVSLLSANNQFALQNRTGSGITSTQLAGNALAWNITAGWVRGIVDQRFYVNGTASTITTQNFTALKTFNRLRVGSAFNLNFPILGAIAELQIYDSVLSEENITTIYNSINSKWNVNP